MPAVMSRADATPLLEARNVSKYFRGDHRPSATSIPRRSRRGAWSSRRQRLAGKSTLMKIPVRPLYAERRRTDLPAKTGPILQP